MAIDGIDVSNNNGTIDWGKVAAGGKEFAVIKATEGLNFTDQDFDYNWREARAHGLVRGAYHFARPSEGTGRQEALYFLSRVVEVIEVGDFLALDLED
ncbi:MAG TPA: GH25 family lysozyme, partial [Chloroflexota bacterium]|nr:GH25 family lysozyme [Chloroflexota bacterium]